jgi:hypothetical protein
MTSPIGVARLYRYLGAKWALKAIETGELRVSRFAELNDPFEFMPALPFVNPIYPSSANRAAKRPSELLKIEMR